MASNDLMEKVVALAKRRGFVFPTSEIYGGLANSYDYGPAGAEMLRNIRNLWWKEFIQKRSDMVGLDSQIILHPDTWVASGHVESFNDPLVEDIETHKRYRADHLIETYFNAISEKYEEMAKEVEVTEELRTQNRTDFNDFIAKDNDSGDKYEHLMSQVTHEWFYLFFSEYKSTDAANRRLSNAFHIVIEELRAHASSESGNPYYWRSMLSEMNKSNISKKSLIVLLYFIAWGLKVENMSIEDMKDLIENAHFLSPDGNDLDFKSPDKNPVSDPKAFNQLFETGIGTVSGEKSKVYLRGETAQGIFTNFKQILDSTRVKLPFGVGQIGRSFRNEITTGQFIFRTLEFEQAEIEYFFNPEESNWEELFTNWKDAMHEFVTTTLGIKPENLRWRQHTDKERSHYSKDTYDLDYNFPFGWKELWGVAYRTDYDLQQHIKHSGQSLEYTDPHTGKKFVPHVIEPAVGMNRMMFMSLCDAYSEEDGRVVLKLSPKIAPYKVAIFPLLGNKEDLISKAREIYGELKSDFMVAWDDRGNIGKRYAAQDEIGTPYCVTVDFQSLEDNMVTIRDRDTGEQERIEIDKLKEFITQKISG